VKRFEAGNYYWISKPDESDRCLVYCYVNPDYLDGEFSGLGFNIADGAGWIPSSDVPDDTIVERAYP